MRVAVVGAGVSGLAATKCCLDEGLEPTCFEQSQDIGGLWRYTVSQQGPSCCPGQCSSAGGGLGGLQGVSSGHGADAPGVPWQEHIEAGRPSVYPSLISNTSKEMSAFSDFPFPEHFPVFLPNALFLDYLRRYAERFGLRERIKFGVSDPALPHPAPQPC